MVFRDIGKGLGDGAGVAFGGAGDLVQGVNEDLGVEAA